MNTLDGYERQASFFQALSHPVRLRILDILARQEACVCHLTTILRRPQPYVSQQLATLREVGLIADRREGTLIYYRLIDEQLVAVLNQSKKLVRKVEDVALNFPPEPEVPLANCPCPRCQA